ncbi:MAG: hypothetical protein ACK501_14630 [Planctomycetota bacterium]
MTGFVVRSGAIVSDFLRFASQEVVSFALSENSMFKSCVAKGILLAGIAAILPAQVREGNRVVFRDGLGDVAHGDRSFEMLWRWQIAGQRGSGRLLLPFDVPGDICPINPARILVSGLSSSDGAGWIVDVSFHLQPGPLGSTVEASVADVVWLGPVDPYRVWSNGDKVLAFDLSGNAVLAGSLAGGLANMVLVPVLDATLMPSIAEDLLALDYEFFGLSQAVGADFGPSADAFLAGPARRRITWDGSQWTSSAETPRVLPSLAPSQWWVSLNPVVDPGGAGYVVVVGGGDGSFLIRDSDDGSVRFSGTIAAGGQQAQAFIVPSTALLYGHRYHVEGAASPSSARSISLRLYPTWSASSMPSGGRGGEVYVRWDYPSIGNDTVAWNFRYPAAAGRSSITALVVGPWDLQQWPLVDSGLGFDVLYPQFGTLGPELGFLDERGGGVGAFSLDVGSPVFQGVRVAFQVVALVDLSTYLASDAVGVVLH